MDELYRLAKTKQEHDAWRRLSTELLNRGIVTRADAESLVNVQITPGQRLYHLIREWGESLVELRFAHDATKEDTQCKPSQNQPVSTD